MASFTCDNCHRQIEEGESKFTLTFSVDKVTVDGAKTYQMDCFDIGSFCLSCIATSAMHKALQPSEVVFLLPKIGKPDIPTN
jgi:hypothetical protein